MRTEMGKVMRKIIKVKSDSLSQIFSMSSCAGGRRKRRREKRLKNVDILSSLTFLPSVFSFFLSSSLVTSSHLKERRVVLYG